MQINNPTLTALPAHLEAYPEASQLAPLNKTDFNPRAEIYIQSLPQLVESLRASLLHNQSQLIQNIIDNFKAQSTTKGALSAQNITEQLMQIVMNEQLNPQDKKTALDKLAKDLGISSKQMQETYLKPLSQEMRKTGEALKTKIESEKSRLESDLKFVQGHYGENSNEAKQIESQLAYLGSQLQQVNRQYFDAAKGLEDMQPKKKKKGFFSKLFGGIKKIFKPIGKVFSKIAPTFKKALSWIQPISQFIPVVGPIISKVATALNSGLNSTQKMFAPFNKE